MKGMNKALVLAAVVLGGCSLYADDDMPIDVDAGMVDVDAAPQPVMTTYRVTWECITVDNCTSPLVNETLATVRELDGSASIVWHHEGATVPPAIHDGTMSGGCIQVLAGSDAGLARANYNACPIPGSPAPALEATITWSTSTWRAVLTRA